MDREEIGRPLDLTQIALPGGWDTVDRIITFIQQKQDGGARGRPAPTRWRACRIRSRSATTSMADGRMRVRSDMLRQEAAPGELRGLLGPLLDHRAWEVPELWAAAKFVQRSGTEDGLPHVHGGRVQIPASRVARARSAIVRSSPRVAST